MNRFIFSLFLVFACSFSKAHAQSFFSPKKFDLDVLIFKGTAWNEPLVQRRIIEINRVFAQCGVAIGNLSIAAIEPPTGEVNLYRDMEMKGPGGLRQANLVMGPTLRLTLVLIRQFQEGLAGTSGIPRFFGIMYPEIVNRAWVTEEIFEPTYTSVRDPAYVTEAHELAHILLNDGHIPDGTHNLMSGNSDFVNGKLEAQQCSQLRNSPFVY